METIQLEYVNENGSRSYPIIEPINLELIDCPSDSKKEWVLNAYDVHHYQSHPFMLKNIHRVFDNQIQRIFCVTIFVMNSEGKFLMLFHKKLNCWMPPGGKIDRHETPEEAAVRECYEETGIEIQIIGNKTPVDNGLISPCGMQLHPVVPNQRDHVDLIYFGAPIGSTQLRVSEREAAEVGWFSYEEILNLDTFASVRQWCQHFMQEVYSQKQ